MTKNDIIQELFLSKDFTKCIKRMRPENLQEDLKSEVILVLLEKDDSKIQELHATHGLKFYTVRIILNLIKSNTSPFYKKFRMNTVELSEMAEPITEDYDPKKDEAMESLDKLYWYDREIMKLYAEHGTYRKIEEVTGIPWESAYKTIQRSCKEIRSKVA